MEQTESLILTSETEEDTDNERENEDSLSLTSSKLPHILTGEFFEVTTSCTDQKIIAQCQNCPKTISGSKTSTGNFVSHYKVSLLHFYQI